MPTRPFGRAGTLTASGIHAAAFGCGFNTHASSPCWLRPLLLLPLPRRPSFSPAAGRVRSGDPATPTPPPRPLPRPRLLQQAGEVTFMAGFKPQANLPFVGAYVAQEKGFFEEQALKVEIQHSDGSGEECNCWPRAGAVRHRRRCPGAGSALGEGRPSSPSLWWARPVSRAGCPWPARHRDAHGLGRQDGGLPQHHPARLLCHPEGERRRSQHGEDGERRLPAADPPLREGGGRPAVFLSNEPDTIRRQGNEVAVFRAADYGVPTLGLTYPPTRTSSRGPCVVERFLKAALGNPVRHRQPRGGGGYRPQVCAAGGP